jgi:hypothetical protein
MPGQDQIREDGLLVAWARHPLIALAFAGPTSNPS